MRLFPLLSIPASMLLAYIPRLAFSWFLAGAPRGTQLENTLQDGPLTATQFAVAVMLAEQTNSGSATTLLLCGTYLASRAFWNHAAIRDAPSTTSWWLLGQACMLGLFSVAVAGALFSKN